MNPTVCACVPCRDSAISLPNVLNSILQQTRPTKRTILIDDGSRDNSKEIAEKKGFKVIRNPSSQGRGQARKMAVDACKEEFLLFCDSTNILPSDFLARAMTHFVDDKVAAVSGKIANHSSQRGIAARWRGRHLFKEQHDFGKIPKETKNLTTYGTLMRTQSIIEVGNFDSSLKHSEDQELGRRLIKAGYRIIGDPELTVYSIREESWHSVLERYWRWYGGVEESISLSGYVHAIRSSINPMTISDLRNGDILVAILSLYCPHYGFMRHLIRKCMGRAQRPKFTSSSN